MAVTAVVFDAGEKLAVETSYREHVADECRVPRMGLELENSSLDEPPEALR